MSENINDNPHWIEISNLIKANYGFDRIFDSSITELILSDSFNYLVYSFEKIAGEVTDCYFFHYVFHNLELILERLKQNLQNGNNESEFNVLWDSMKICKMILAQGTLLELKTYQYQDDTAEERESRYHNYKERYRELKTIGKCLTNLGNHIASNKIFTSCIYISFEENQLHINFNQPFQEVLSSYFSSLKNHQSGLSIQNTIEYFHPIIEESLGLTMISFEIVINKILSNQNNKAVFFDLDNFKLILSQGKQLEKKNLDNLLAGLISNNENSLSLEEYIFERNEKNSLYNKTIIEYNINGKKKYLLGLNKWKEGIDFLCFFHISHGIFPDEWKEIPLIDELFKTEAKRHSNFLEEPAFDLIKKYHSMVDQNVESLLQFEQGNFNIKDDTGDLDLIFIDETKNIINVCECKNLLSRFGMVGWRKDYNKMKYEHESQLERKLNFVKQNKKVIQDHFSIKFNKTLNLDSYNVNGFFIINAPTLYMYNGKYKALTISDLERYLNNKHTLPPISFIDNETGLEVMIEYPYFDNAENYIKSKTSE